MWSDLWCSSQRYPPPPTTPLRKHFVSLFMRVDSDERGRDGERLWYNEHCNFNSLKDFLPHFPWKLSFTSSHTPTQIEVNLQIVLWMWITCVPYYMSLSMARFLLKKKKKTRNKGKVKGSSNMSYSFSRRFSEAIKLSYIHLTLDDDIPHEVYYALTLFSVALTYFSVTVRVERWGWKLLWKETLFLNKLIIWSILNELYYRVTHGQFQAHYVFLWIWFVCKGDDWHNSSLNENHYICFSGDYASCFKLCMMKTSVGLNRCQLFQTLHDENICWT